uniref:Adhesion G protein-coupled receptor F7 n=1 Tax=Xiphophorus maculatus TaxID=8083 RepID=M3ZZV4_XIPMA
MVNTTVTHTTSPETAPSTTDARTYSSETILNSRLLDATSSGMDLSTRVTNKTTTDQSQNTIMSNATSQEKLNTLLTDVTTTQVAVNKTVVDVVTSEITLNATVTHATTQKITLKTTMSNATSPETILDTTVANVTPKQTAVETTSNAAILEKTTTIRKCTFQLLYIDFLSFQNILETVGTLTIGKAKTSWETLNNNNTRNTDETKEGVKVNNASSSLLYSIERITSRLVNKSFSIETPHICLNKFTFVNCSVDLNSSVKIDTPNTCGHNHSITTIIFAFMDNVLPPRDKSNSSSKVINGKVALLWPEDKITNISLAFHVLDDRLRNPECVFWDFNLFGGLGGWNDDGCSLVFNENGMTSCHCNHTTSFSILMSPNSSDQFISTYITYIGLAISIVSLIICLITEGIIWKTIGDNMTLYFRHVSIVNIALSLLIADIWFIIGAAISNTKSVPACTAATFFIHSFYLALFFWMLASALLLLYRTFNVFAVGLSKKAMLIIGFSLGYGAPLIIATITIAVTAPSNHYIGETNVFWLSWDMHKTSLAFVIPALIIVAINIIILTLVISKILRRRVGMIGTQAKERHALLAIVRCTAVLTPIFGVTWVLGIGTMVSENVGLDVAFALLNSLQVTIITTFLNCDLSVIPF